MKRKSSDIHGESVYRSLMLLPALFFIVLQLSAQDVNTAKGYDFNGYMQVRAWLAEDGRASFMVRRMKLWLKSEPSFSTHWSYKLQATVSSLQQEHLMFQDVKLAYHRGAFVFALGQFVPQYSLQRFQPDYAMAAIERAQAVDKLIPNGSLGVRDIGMQLSYHSPNKIFRLHAGLFNGYGVKEYRIDNKGFMLTQKSEMQLPVKSFSFCAGYSLQYRYAEALSLTGIFPDTFLYSGRDFRYNFFAAWKAEKIALQAEYLHADFSGEEAYGYYLQSVFNFRKNQMVLGMEKYKDLIGDDAGKTFYRMGYNYYFRDYKIKCSLDNFFAIRQGKFVLYRVSVQMQIFIK